MTNRKWHLHHPLRSIQAKRYQITSQFLSNRIATRKPFDFPVCGTNVGVVGRIIHGIKGIGISCSLLVLE